MSQRPHAILEACFQGSTPSQNSLKFTLFTNFHLFQGLKIKFHPPKKLSPSQTLFFPFSSGSPFQVWRGHPELSFLSPASIPNEHRESFSIFAFYRKFGILATFTVSLSDIGFFPPNYFFWVKIFFQKLEISLQVESFLCFKWSIDDHRPDGVSGAWYVWLKACAPCPVIRSAFTSSHNCTICARLPPCDSQQIADNTQQHIGGELVCASIECLGHLAAHCSNARGNFYMDIEHYIEPLPLEHCTLCWTLLNIADPQGKLTEHVAQMLTFPRHGLSRFSFYPS